MKVAITVLWPVDDYGQGWICRSVPYSKSLYPRIKPSSIVMEKEERKSIKKNQQCFIHLIYSSLEHIRHLYANIITIYVYSAAQLVYRES